MFPEVNLPTFFDQAFSDLRRSLEDTTPGHEAFQPPAVSTSTTCCRRQPPNWKHGSARLELNLILRSVYITFAPVPS